MNIARVALDVPLDEVFDYLAPQAGADDIGRRVRVPFGRREAVGVIVALAETSSLPAARLKPVRAILRDAPALSAADLALLRFCADYYHHPLGEVVLNALPVRLRQAEAPSPLRVRYVLSEAGRALQPDALPRRAVLQKRLLVLLQQKGGLFREEVAALSPSAPAALKRFLAQGWVSAQDTLPEQGITGEADAPPPPALTSMQAAAVAAVAAGFGRFGAWLLHGITGSGKTEVYLRLITQVLQRGGQALVLVPEISLTPQLETRLRQRFAGRRLVTLHSGMAENARTENWLLAQAGHADIVLGTRLAVFTPLPRLALIVVDEEHDASYKQQDGLRYSARDVAVARARLADVPVLLGSATPALESWHNAHTGRYALLQLSERAAKGAALPDIHLVDTRRFAPWQGFTQPLLQAIETRLARGEQSLVFINRRGFAPVLLCGACGWVAPCPRCAARLVVHLRERRLRCHHCGHEERIPVACPGCGNADLTTLGHGTQRVEETLAERFPAARIVRVDRDSTRRRHAMQKVLDAVHAGEADILVGTQMLAKGHDFPALTLVGVLDADGALYSADFRAAERLFAQLMQVAGRAGRAAARGEVLVQTGFPDQPLFQALQRHDYAAFAAQQLAERRAAGFPPFCHQALVRAEATRLADALAFLQAARAVLPGDVPEVVVYGPVPAPMARLAGRERAQLLLQSATRRALHALLAAWLPALRGKGAARVRWSLDVDPLEC